MDARTIIDYAKSLDCIHCGLCLQSCPTYRLTGRETSSPRGRIHMMRAVAEGTLAPDRDVREELDFCLLCRGCESVCPSGVHFGAMMETARDGIAAVEPRGLLERTARCIGFGLLGRRWWLSRVAGLARFAQRSGLLRLVAPLLGARGKALRATPTFPSAGERRSLPPRSLCAHSCGQVTLLEGCVQRELFPHVNRATVRVLNAAGFDVLAPADGGCCGSLHAHNGELDQARALARRMIDAFDDEGSQTPIVVNSAGCSAHMKEVAELFGESDPLRPRAEAFAKRVVDVSEFLAREEPLERLSDMLDGSLHDPGSLAFDDPCHLCHAQGVRNEPRTLLDTIPALQRSELNGSELCCGSAGIYSILRPADSAAILDPKLDSLEESGVRTLVTANPGCAMQWSAGIQRRGLDVRVAHVVEVLDEALQASGGTGAKASKASPSA